MNSPLVTHNLRKSFDGHLALDALTLEVPAGRVVGLLGRNGSGKTTLIHTACGLILPTEGTCQTLGEDCAVLDSPQLNRIGVVFQEERFVDWMTVRQQLEFNSSFYPGWDQARERRLLEDLEIDPKRKISQLSTGDRQKVAILLAVCHHPALLLLDEPVSALDPIIRNRLLRFLVDLIAEDGCTILVSSHVLTDVEKIVDWILCLDRGRLVTNEALDDLQESYAEWIVSSADAQLPKVYSEPWVLSHEGDDLQARLLVRIPEEAVANRFLDTHGANAERRPLNLDQLFPLLLAGNRPRR